MTSSSSKKPSPLKRLGKRLKNLYMDLRIYLHYQELNPTVVQLSQSDHRVAVDPHDARARKRLIVDSLRGRLPRNQRFWRRACQELNPSVVLDIGVNYGECLFSVNYPADTRVIGVEANPFLISRLNQSQSFHGNASQIAIHNVLAGETPLEEVSFFINQVTSGESTAAIGSVDANPNLYKQVAVPQVRVDDLIPEQLDSLASKDRPIVFKIDVEGYEERVFQGMEKLLDSSLDLVGLIEFDLSMLEDASSDPQLFFDFLKQRFDVYLFLDKNEAVRVSDLEFQKFHELLSNTKFHSDLLLIRSATPNRFAAFLRHWQPLRMSA